MDRAMSKKQFTPEKLANVETTTRIIRVMNRFLGLCLAVAFGLLITATAVPQKRQFEKLQGKLRQTQAREENALAAKEFEEIKLQALREDTSYLEVEARDRLNYYRPGEKVLRFSPDDRVLPD